MPIIKPCPICNKIPKIECDSMGLSNYITTIMCKPWLGKAHYKIVSVDYYSWRSQEVAINKWNKIAQQNNETKNIEVQDE